MCTLSCPAATITATLSFVVRYANYDGLFQDRDHLIYSYPLLVTVTASEPANLFAEPMSYYFRPAIRSLFFYELFKRPLGMMKLALARNNEIGFGDKRKWQRTKTEAQLSFLMQNDYS